MKEFKLNRDHLLELSRSLITFLKHPLREIQHVPDWSWRDLILVQVFVSAGTGVLANLVTKNIVAAFLAIVLSPILTTMTIAVSSLFFYYLFQIVAGQTLPFRRLVTVVFFATLPFFIFQIVAGLVPPISLVGFAFTALILIVGFVQNFQLPRKLVIRSIAALYVLIFLIWIWSRWDALQLETSWRSEKIEAPEVQLGE